MIVPRTHDLIHQVSLVCQKQKPLGFFVKAANWINPYRIVQIFGDRGLLALLLSAAYNAPGLIKQKEDLLLHLFHWLAIHEYHCICCNLFSWFCRAAFHSHPSVLDQAIRFPP